MPKDLWKGSVNLDYLYPPFLEAVLNLQTECRMLGVDYKVYSGFRPHDEQRELYDKYLKGGPLAAPAGLSSHNYGLAVDCARLQANKLLSWTEDDYDVLLRTIPKHGLVSGASFKDLPHVQWPGYVSARQLLPLKVLFNSTTGDELTKLKAVWSKLDSGN